MNQIEQFTQARTALLQLRQSLVDQIAEIDAALANSLTKPKPKEPSGSKQPKAGIKENIITAVEGTAGLTIKEIQTLVSTASAKSVEATVHQMASEGRLLKDTSTPRKFSLPKTNGATKTNGASV